MKRQLLPPLVVIGGLTAVCVVIFLFSLEARARKTAFALDETALAGFDAGLREASDAPQADVRAHRVGERWRPNTRPAGPGYPIENLLLHVNYADDLVEGNAELNGLMVAITLTAADDSQKGAAVVSSGAGGDFVVGCLDWSASQCPDIVPGDRLFAAASNQKAEINPIGHIAGQLNEVTDSVTGTLLAPGSSGTLNVACQVWTAPGSAVIHKTADASGGSFTCDFMAEAGWDLLWGQEVALSYQEDDGDTVTNVAPWPWARVNYGQEWVGMNYDMGRTFWLTVTDGGGAVKGTAQVETTSAGGWDEPGFQTEPDEWSPARPNITPGDWVYFAADDGYQNTVQVGTISGTLDVDADRLDGQIFASQFGMTLTVECQPWGAWDDGTNAPVKVSWAEPDGSVPFSCQWGPGEWDIQPGQEVAAMYLQPDHDRIINVFDWPNITANIGPRSGGDRHVWGYGALPGGQVVVSVTNSGGDFLVGATAPADERGDWDTGSTLPAGALALGNRVKVDFGNGIIDDMQIWAISGKANPDSDVVTITATGPPGFEVNLELCDAAACEWYELGDLGLAGIVRVDMMAEFGVNLEPDMVYHANLVVWNDHVLIYSWDELGPDMTMNVNYGLDRVEGAYEVGHTVWITVTESDGTTVKGSAELTTAAIPWWGGQPGFSTDLDGWTGPAPDIMPGDWVFARSDEGFQSQVEVGEISGQVDVVVDVTAGYVSAPWIGQLDGRCQVLEPGGPNLTFMVSAAAGPYVCDFDPWDLTLDQQVLVEYREPDGDWVGNVFQGHLPHLRIEKSAASVPVVGGQLWFTIEYWNQGGGPAEGVTISDTMLGGMTYITDTSGLARTGTGSGPITWQVGPLANGPHQTFDVLVAVTAAVSQTITNTAQIEASPPLDLGQPEDRVAQWTGQVVTAVPELRIGKTYESSRLPLAAVNYTLRFSNVGTVAVSGLVISDRLPANVTWLSGGSYDDASQVITWTWPSLAAGASAEATFNGQLACAGQVINDRYGVIAKDQGVASSPGPAVALDIISPTIDLSFNHPDVPVAGGETQFQAVASSNGPTPLTYAWDFGDGGSATGPGPGHVYQAPGEFTVVLTATDPCGYFAVYQKALVVSEPDITADFDQSHDALPVHGTVQFTDTSTTNGSDIVAWRWDFGDGSPSSDQQNPSHTYHAHDTFTVTLVVTDDLGYQGTIVKANAVTTLTPILEIGKSVQGAAVARTIVTYTLTVSNVGDLAGTGLVITDRLPLNVTWVSGGAYDGASGIISWHRASLAAGREATVQFSGRLACAGQVVNDRYGVIASDQGVASPPGPEVGFDILPPTIGLSFTHPADPAIGGETQFQAMAASNGPAPLTYSWDFGDGGAATGPAPAHVYQSLGDFMVVLTAADPCGYTNTYRKTLTVGEPDITADFDQSANVVAIHRAVHFTDTTSTNGPDIVAWRWDFGDGSPPSDQQNPGHTYHAHDTFTVTLVVTDALGYSGMVVKPNTVRTLAPIFEIGKSVEGNQVAGAIVTYTLTVSNVGDLAGTGLVITDRLPSNVTYVSGGSYDSSSGVVSWQLPNLATGQTAEVQFSGRLGCSGQAINDRYRVSASDQQVVSPWGDPVSFAIAAPTITAAFSQSATEVRVGQRVFFNSTSTTDDGPLTSFSWDFDDGQSGSGASVSHGFSAAGLYQVTLTVGDACGAQDSVSHPVNVKHTIFIPFIARR